MRYNEYIDINTDSKTLFRHLTEAKLLLEWMNGLVNIKSKGAKARRKNLKQTLSFKDLKGVMEIKEQTLDYLKDEKISVKWESEQMEVSMDYNIATNAKASVCRLSVNAKVRLQPRFLNFISFLFAGPIKKQWSSDLSSLKKIIENSHPN